MRAERTKRPLSSNRVIGVHKGESLEGWKKKRIRIEILESSIFYIYIYFLCNRRVISKRDRIEKSSKIIIDKDKRLDKDRVSSLTSKRDFPSRERRGFYFISYNGNALDLKS